MFRRNILQKMMKRGERDETFFMYHWNVHVGGKPHLLLVPA